MSKYTEFFFNTSTSVRALETLQIAHPNFSQTYWIVRNARYGITAKLESGAEQFFQFYPLQISGIGVNQTLDQVLQVQLGDLGTILPQELDRIATANGFSIKPTCTYRAYRSDDLTAPMNGPTVLEITDLPFNSQGASFQASAPTINNNKTGEQYTLDRFPMLRGFL